MLSSLPSRIATRLGRSLALSGCPSAADRVHQPLGLDEPRGVDLVPLPLAGDALAEDPGDRVVVGPAAEEGADVGLLEGEEAVAELAVGGQADAVAARAERPADRGDQ